MAVQRGRNRYLTAKSTGLIITSLIDFFSIVVIYFHNRDIKSPGYDCVEWAAYMERSI